MDQSDEPELTPDAARKANEQLKNRIRRSGPPKDLLSTGQPHIPVMAINTTTPSPALASDEALASLRRKLDGLPDVTITVEGVMTPEGAEAFVGAFSYEEQPISAAHIREASRNFLEEILLVPTPDAVDQLAEAFVPCLEIMCKRGYDPNGATWRKNGWRGTLWEMWKRMQRLLYMSWENDRYDLNDAIDLTNFTAFYIRFKNQGPPFGQMGNPK
jgi:hypothetical protein